HARGGTGHGQSILARGQGRRHRRRRFWGGFDDHLTTSEYSGSASSATASIRTSSWAVTLKAPPSAATESAAPPGIFSAGSMTEGPPLARTIIDEGTSCPSTATPPAGREVTELEATTRTSPTWITSAPALRSSWITPSTVGARTDPAGSVIVMLTPRP